MGNKGGARPGAGRPRNAEKYADEIASLNDAIAKDILEIYGKAMELVRGVKAVRYCRDTEYVYEKPPDAKMIIALLERLAGRPSQAVEHSGVDGGPIQSQVTIYLPDNGRAPRDGDPTPGGPAGAVAEQPG